MGERGRGGDPPAGGPGQQTRTDQERLGDLLDRVGFLPHSDRQSRQAHRTAAEAAHQRLQHGPVEPVQAERVYIIDAQGGPGDLARDDSVRPHLGVVTNPAQQPVGDPRRPTRPPGNLGGAVAGETYPQQPGRAGQHTGQLIGIVEVHVCGEPEPITQRAGEKT